MAGNVFLAPEYMVRSAVEDFVANRFEIHTIPENSNQDAGFWFVMDHIFNFLAI